MTNPSILENQYASRTVKFISNCNCCSNKFKLYMNGSLVIAMYLFLFMCIYLRVSSDSVFQENHQELVEELNVKMPGPFIPVECEDYMKNCARVSFDGCMEKKYDLSSATCAANWFFNSGRTLPCQQMDEAFQNKNKLGRQTAMFF